MQRDCRGRTHDVALVPGHCWGEASEVDHVGLQQQRSAPRLVYVRPWRGPRLDKQGAGKKSKNGWEYTLHAAGTCVSRQHVRHVQQELQTQGTGLEAMCLRRRGEKKKRI